MSQFVMTFIVARPRPRPFVVEAAMRDDGSLDLPRRFAGHVLPIGAVVTFYNIPAKELREDWIRAALLDPVVDGWSVHNWGVTYDEWLAVLKRNPDITPVPMKHVYPDHVKGPHNDPKVQAAARNDLRWQPQVA